MRLLFPARARRAAPPDRPPDPSRLWNRIIESAYGQYAAAYERSWDAPTAELRETREALHLALITAGRSAHPTDAGAAIYAYEESRAAQG